MSPTPRTALLLGAIALTALALPVAAAVAAALVLAGATLADAAIGRRGPAVSREVPEILSRGVPAPLAIEAEVPPGRALVVRQAAPPDVRIEPSQAQPPLRAEVIAGRRGRHRLPGVATRTQGPLGLAAWYRTVPGDAEVKVYPDLPAARAVAATARTALQRDTGVKGRGPLGLGTEFESIRDYSPDDDIRQVNWLATARLGRPMSNQFRLEQDRDVVAVIDAGRLMAAPIEGRTRLDAALDAFAALAAVADDLGDRFGALAFDGTVRRKLRPRRRGGAAAVRAFFDLEPSPVDSDYQGALQRLEAKRAFVVVFTDLLDEAAARSLLAAMPALVRRHAVAVATARDPDLDDAADSPPEDVLGAYRAVAALDVLRGRRAVALRLRRAGAAVIDAPAASLGAACVGAYLTAKSRALV